MSITEVVDAAHPMHPTGSQAGSQTIVDARALTAALLATTDPVEALALYDAERRPPMNEVTLRDRANGGLPRLTHSPRFLVRARGAVIRGRRRVVAGRRCSYGDAADRQRDRANGGLPLWVFLLWNFGGYWPLVSSIASRAEGYPYLMALSGCEVARSGPGGGRVGGAEAIPGR